MAGSVGKDIVTDGIVLYFDPANTKSYTSGSTTCNDIFKTDPSVNGVLTNGVSVDTSDDIPSFVFDGVNDYIEMDEFSFSGTQITVSVWNFGETVSKSQCVFEAGTAAINTKRCIALLIPWSDSTVYFDAGNALVNFYYDRISKSATVAECNGWHHWVFTKDSATGNQRIYHDGSLWHSGTGNPIPLVSGDRSSVGRFSGGGLGYYQQGKISQLIVYNKELSASEVLQNYNATKDRFI